MLDKRILGVPVLWFGIGSVVLVLLIMENVLGSYLAYSNAVSIGLARTEAIERSLGTKIDKVEGDLALQIDQHQTDTTHLQSKVDGLNKAVIALEKGRKRLQMQVFLLKASARVARASVYLANESPGLAKRDLATAIESLEQAQLLAPLDQELAIGEIITSLTELRQSIEVKAYPIATLEILIDKLDTLIGKSSQE
ncbi:MAG: hypothetical protein HZB51_16495 [Chloroflexi bacterium]|nr:hypothetical protein [Chloroflexota bacterium]